MIIIKGYLVKRRVRSNYFRGKLGIRKKFSD